MILNFLPKLFFHNRNKEQNLSRYGNKCVYKKEISFLSTSNPLGYKNCKPFQQKKRKRNAINLKNYNNSISFIIPLRIMKMMIEFLLEKCWKNEHKKTKYSDNLHKHFSYHVYIFFVCLLLLVFIHSNLVRRYIFFVEKPRSPRERISIGKLFIFSQIIFLSCYVCSNIHYFSFCSIVEL